MNRIHKAFEKKAFIGFLTAGDPVIDKTIDYILELEKAGASLIEIGIPFSDPIAEGPTIQDANVRALKNHVHTDHVFDMVKKLRTKTDIPLCFMTYLNVVFHYGYERFFTNCKEVGIDGIIIPDLPYEEANEVKEVCTKYDVTLISMIAPTSKDRVEMIAKEAEGFIYLVSSMGVTGTRNNDNFSTNLEEIIGHIKKVTDTPVAIGFGINTPKQVEEFSKYADGVIVGSAIINIIKEYGDKADAPLYDYVKSLTDAL
jgi:tryptophan synthase alpha chain